MLARASSDAGTRLRHAKSTSSVHSRGKAAIAEPSDPFIVRDHATAAAVQAFERAYPFDHTRSRAERSLELSRRRSTASRASQGSHFPPRGSSLRQAGEDSAIRHRKSTQSHRFSIDRQQSNSPNVGAALAATPQHHLRNHVPASSVASAPLLPKDTAPISSPTDTPCALDSKKVRKSRSMYNSWGLGFGSSRETRQDAAADARFFPGQRLKENGALPIRDNEPKDHTVSQRTSEAPSAEDIAAARDKVLQSFQKNKLRARPSFTFTPFKKRPVEPQQQTPSAAHEHSPSPHGTPPLGIPAPTITPARLEEKRSFSGSLKSRFKKVFRKTSKPTISLPVQQVDASRAYFGDPGSTTPCETSPYSATATPAEYFASSDVPRPSSRQRISSDISNHSRKSFDDHDVSDISKSRVTSWTNSSVTNSLNSRDPRRLSMIPEFEPASEKKRNTSILGRSPFRKPLHLSPHGITRGPDSFDVFSALKSRLEKAGLDSNLDPDLPNTETQPLHDKTERAMLPSQTRNSSNTSKLSRATKATIRTVTPEIFGRSRPKDLAGEGHREFEDDEDSGRNSPDEDGSGLILPRIRLQRAAKATIPTPEQISTRKKRSENRWQAQLGQGHSPVFSKNIKKAMAGDNPYELKPFDRSSNPYESIGISPRTSSRKPQEPIDMLSPNWPSRADIMSPSVYSRDSSGESPVRKESDGSNCPPGTVVIVSSHSAKSYTLGSSPKKDTGSGSVRSSKDWKTWLSKEMSELNMGQDCDMSMTEEWLLKPTGHQREHAEIVGVGDDDDEVVIFKSRPASGSFPNRPERLTLIDPPIGTTGESTEIMAGERKSGNDASTPPDEGLVINKAREVSVPDENRPKSKASGGAHDKDENEYARPSRDGSNSAHESSHDANRALVSTPATCPGPEEKIPVSTLTDRSVHHARSCQSIHRSADRSHSSLAQYTTSAEDPDMPQLAATLVRPSPSAYTAPVANPPFRFRPADPSFTATARVSPFSRPRSAFDLRNQYSSAGLRSAAAAIPPPSRSAAASTPTATRPTLLPPPPHHSHHLRRKPVAVGVRRGRLTPSPTPAPSFDEEGETMHMIMQGPYGRSTTPESSSSTPPWVPPPPPQSEAARSPLASARHHWNIVGQHPLLATRQSTPALRVTPRPGSARLGVSGGGVGMMGQQQGAKENAVPVLASTTPNNKNYGEVADMQQGSAERESGTPSPGQLLAERWLCARQQRGGGGVMESAAGENVVSGSPAFL